MFVQEITTESREATITIQSPSWEKIEAAILNLDGIQNTLMTMSGDGVIHMGLGGGAEGQYVAYVTFDNFIFYNLAAPEKQEEVVSLVVGGQTGHYDAKQCVDLVTVLKAAKTFALSGELDPLVYWEVE